MKKPTSAMKKKILKEWLDGAEKEEVMAKYNVSAQQLAGWKRYYGDQVEEQGEVKEQRRERIPLTEQDRFVVAGQDPNYVYRGVVEDSRRVGAVERAKLAGWEPTTEAEMQLNVRSMANPSQPGAVNSITSGLGSTTYFMRKRKDWYEEDMKKLDEKHKTKEDAIFGELKKTGRYGHISVGGRTEER